jgi:hypothetical protein
MPLTTTNAPPTDPNLLNRNIVRKPRLVDVGAPEPVPKPRLVDVGKPEPVAVPRLVDVGKPTSQSVEELVQQIDGDQNFIPSDEQLTEYFAYNDEQPFDYKKTWDASVNAVGTALGDITKAVGAAIVDPEFMFNPINPVKRVATFAEGAARGTWDLSILGRMMTDKLDEVHSGYYNNFPESPTSDEWSKESKLRNPRKFLVKKHNEAYPDKKIDWRDIYRDGYTEIEPGDYNLFKNQWNEEMGANRRDKWRTMRWITNTRNLAREGKKTIIGEFLGEDVDKALLPYIKQEVAEGSSYFLDPTLPVGFLSAPAKATVKPLVTRIPGLTNVQLLERGLIAPTVEFTGRTLKNTGKKVDEIISKIGAKVEENTDLVKAAQPIMTGASAAAGAYVAPESVGMLGGAVAGAVGGKYGVPQIGKLKAIPKAITIAGEGVEAIGRSMGKPETLESTLQQAARIAESEPARKLLKGAARLDPAISLVDNLVTGAIEGSKAGGILASPSGDEEFIGGAMGTGAALGGGGGVVGGIVGEKYRTKKQAENTVNEWFNSKTEAEQKSIQNLKLTPVEAANVATAEMLGRGIIGKDKISDINFIYLSQPEFIKKIHPELLVDGELPKVLPPGTRGAMSSPDGTPTVYVNTGHTGPRSVFHEMMHSMLKFDEMGDHRVELRSQLFDQKAEDGTVLKRGMFSEDDIDVFFDQYLSRLPEEMRGAWEEQFKVYKDDFEEFTNPDGTKELKRVIDEEATRKNERELIMEEVEAESFANFVKDSGPTFLRQSRSIRQMIADRFLLQDNLKKTRVLRSVLEKSGVPFGADGIPTGVFWKDGKPISNNREINKVMRDFVRAKDTATRRLMEDEGGERPALSIGATRAAEGRKKVEAALKSADGKLLVEHFKSNDIFDRKPNGDIKYDALTGMPILLTERQIKKLQANRLEQIQTALNEVGIDGGGMMPKVHKDGSISWSGIPTDAQVAKILEIPNDVIPPGMKDSVTDIVEKMRLPGQSIIMDYNPAIGKSGRYSSNLSSGLRVAIPLGFHVSKAGNFYTTTLDVGAVQLKLKDWANSKTNKNLAMWDGDVRRFEQDMYKYLENHKADRPGETGLAENASTAEAKKNIINDFFGVAQKDANPITDARKATKRSGKARRVENLIRARLFNRMNRIEKNRLTKYGAGTPLPMKTQADAYKKWKENYMPGDEVRYMPGEATRPPVDEVGASDAFGSAKKNHGLTRNIEEAGYILPDGELLDFSGRHQTGEYDLIDGYWKLKPKYDRDYMSGERIVDHREVEYDGVPSDEQWSGMVDFMKRGAVRVDAKAGMISVHGRTPLTKQQENRVREISDLKDGEIYLDAEDDAGKRLSLEYDVSNSKRIIGDLRRWARSDEPESGVRFMPGVEKFDTIEPSIISESVKIKPGAFDNVRFMPGSPAKIPLSKVAESDPFIVLSDQMADMVYTVPGSGVRIELHGGPAFSYRDGRAVWASTKNAATKLGNYVIRTGKNRALIMIQRPDNHAKNKSMGRLFVEELKAREKNITKTDMDKMLLAASKRAKLIVSDAAEVLYAKGDKIPSGKSVGDVKKKAVKASDKSIKNLKELEAAFQDWTWDVRGDFFGQFGLVNKPASPIGNPKKRGFFDYHQIVKDTADPAFADLPVGSIVGAIEFDGGKTYSAGELGTVPHSSYDTMLKGRGLGMFENPPHINDILDLPDNKRSVFTLMRRTTHPNRLKETAQAEADNIIKMPAGEKAKRKDRAKEILKKFIEQ